MCFVQGPSADSETNQQSDSSITIVSNKVLVLLLVSKSVLESNLVHLQREDTGVQFEVLVLDSVLALQYMYVKGSFYKPDE